MCVSLCTRTCMCVCVSHSSSRTGPPTAVVINPVFLQGNTIHLSQKSYLIVKTAFRSGKLPLYSKCRVERSEGMFWWWMTVTLFLVRLGRVDSWIDRAKHRKENGEEGGREGGKLGIQRITPTFHLPSGRAGAQGNNKHLLQPFSLFPGYKEAKPSKNSVTVFLCVR